ncbi:MAG: sugar transferase [Nitrospinota bacterium]
MIGPGNPQAATAASWDELAPVAPPRELLYQLKCGIEFALALLISLPALPLFLVIWILIRLDSPGPATYRPIRLGRDGRRFRLWKFRTMYLDADERLKRHLEANPQFQREYEIYHKLREDPRVTPLGRLLRRYSMDELPQLWNVLQGDMTLVGPRPYDAGELPLMDDKEDIILLVKPGLTGLWQVSGRNLMSFSERLEADVYYVRNWSIRLDLRIWLRTLPVVMSGIGAY